MDDPLRGNPYDTRLSALKNHQEELKNLEAPQDINSKLLKNLLISQFADLAATDKPFGFMAGTHMEEINPLPGMSSPGFGGTAARIGWGGLEYLLAKILLDKFPAVGRIYAPSSTAFHGNLARQNWELANRYRGTP